MRVYELARDLGIDSKEVLAQAQELGLEVKTASSGMDDEGVALVRLAFAPEEITETPVEAETQPAGEAITEETPAEPEPAPEQPDGGEESVPETPEQEIQIAALAEGATVAEFAAAIDQSTGEIVKALLVRGIPAGANQTMPADLIDEMAEGFGFIIELETAPRPLRWRSAPSSTTQTKISPLARRS